MKKFFLFVILVSVGCHKRVPVEPPVFPVVQAIEGMRVLVEVKQSGYYDIPPLLTEIETLLRDGLGAVTVPADALPLPDFRLEVFVRSDSSYSSGYRLSIDVRLYDLSAGSVIANGSGRSHYTYYGGFYYAGGVRYRSAVGALRVAARDAILDAIRVRKPASKLSRALRSLPVGVRANVRARHDNSPGNGHRAYSNYGRR